MIIRDRINRCVTEQRTTISSYMLYRLFFFSFIGVSSEGEKRPEESMTLASGEDDTVDTVEVTEEVGSDLVEDEVEEESREAEASPSSNTRQRTLAASLATASDPNGARGMTVRRSPRSTFRVARGARPTPIVWDSQSGRGK